MGPNRWLAEYGRQFVRESKKLKANKSSKKVDESLLRARSPAENYARALRSEEGRPQTPNAQAEKPGF